MNNETKAVDVLAVLDDAISEFNNLRMTDRHGIGPALREARAAVAELIEENKQLRIKANNWDSLMYARQVTADDSDDAPWKLLARQRNLIESIKSCRAAHGFSLREAKDCVEGYIARVQGGAK